ncbi:MAG: GDP-L-fucose synthase [Alphaproteobacteria bacterium]|nr:GDP-L-fucose synthase [Alphaproteobacteria bacterium]
MISQFWLKEPLSLHNKTIWIAGHNGMVGRALHRTLANEGCRIITASRNELDLRDQAATHQWVKINKPEMIIIAAAKVGGILANDAFKCDFLYDNTMIAMNILHAAYENGVKHVLNLGSSCIYPKDAAQPITEDQLLSSTLEPTNEAYALAKIIGLKLAKYYSEAHNMRYISAMPCNLYGIGDSYHVQNSHVIPALIMKAHEAKLGQSPALEIWGSGKPLREFLYVDDLARALVFLLKNYAEPDHINVGSGIEISIADLAELICEIVGYKGKLVFDTSKPDGTYRKVMDSSALKNKNWAPKTDLNTGLNLAYEDYLKNHYKGEEQRSA